MSELDELYQEVILDHNRQPRNFKELPDASHVAEGYNPLCGDKIKVFLKVDDGVVKEVGFQGSGCAISKASGSLMTMSVKGKTKGEADALFAKVHRMLTRDPQQPAPRDMGRLAVFAGVSEFPARVKCATLAWHTFQAAFDHKAEVVSTEEGGGSSP